MASTLVHLGIDQMQHVEQITNVYKDEPMSKKTLITGTVGPMPIYKNRPTPIQSAVDGMWFRISSRFCSNSKY